MASDILDAESHKDIRSSRKHRVDIFPVKKSINVHTRYDSRDTVSIRTFTLKFSIALDQFSDWKELIICGRTKNLPVIFRIMIQGRKKYQPFCGTKQKKTPFGKHKVLTKRR
jgi:hypothetical protein